MKSESRPFFTIFGFSFMLFIGLLVALFICFFGWLAAIGGGGVCSNEIVQEATTPDGHAKALVYLRDCGATVGYTSHVIILNDNDELGGGKGNVLQAEGSDAWDAIDIIWQDNGTLAVYHQIPIERVHVKKERVSDYEIVFGTCENEIINEAVAPNEQYTAVVYERRCSENVVHTTNVSVFEYGKVYRDRQGNILQVLGNNDKNSVGITWMDSRTLRVTHRVSSEKIIRQKEKQFEVEVIFEKLEN